MRPLLKSSLACIVFRRCNRRSVLVYAIRILRTSKTYEPRKMQSCTPFCFRWSARVRITQSRYERIERPVNPLCVIRGAKNRLHDCFGQLVTFLKEKMKHDIRSAHYSFPSWSPHEQVVTTCSKTTPTPKRVDDRPPRIASKTVKKSYQAGHQKWTTRDIPFLPFSPIFISKLWKPEKKRNTNDRPSVTLSLTVKESTTPCSELSPVEAQGPETT